LRNLTFVSATPAVAGGFDFTFTARVEDRKLDAPAPLPNHVVVARVIKNGNVVSNIDMNGGAPATRIKSQFGQGDEYGGVGGLGPFVGGSISGTDGVSTLTFRLPNPASGNQIQLSIEMVGPPVDAGTFDPRHPQFDNSSLFDLANTPAACRASAVITLP